MQNLHGGHPLTLVSDIEQRVRDLDRNLPLYKIATMEQNLSDSLMRRRFAMLLLATGVLIPLVAMRALASLLYGVAASDPLTFLVVAAVLLAFSSVAGAIPACRACGPHSYSAP
jgi:hypothetical protein